MTDIKLIYAGDSSKKAKNISEYILSGKVNDKEDVKEYYQGNTDIDSIIELLLLTKRLSGEKKQHIVNSTIHQDKVFGHLDNNEGIVAVITKEGHIKYLDENEHTTKLSALYEPFITQIDPFSSEDNVSPANEEGKKKGYFRRLDDKFTMSLKKLKNYGKFPKLDNYSREDIIGQIVDPTKKYTKGIIIKSKSHTQQLVLLSHTGVIKGVPVFAILTTK